MYGAYCSKNVPIYFVEESSLSKGRFYLLCMRRHSLLGGKCVPWKIYYLNGLKVTGTVASLRAVPNCSTLSNMFQWHLNIELCISGSVKIKYILSTSARGVLVGLYNWYVVSANMTRYWHSTRNATFHSPMPSVGYFTSILLRDTHRCFNMKPTSKIIIPHTSKRIMNRVVWATKSQLPKLPNDLLLLITDQMPLP